MTMENIGHRSLIMNKCKTHCMINKSYKTLHEILLHFMENFTKHYLESMKKVLLVCFSSGTALLCYLQHLFLEGTTPTNTKFCIPVSSMRPPKNYINNCFPRPYSQWLQSRQIPGKTLAHKKEGNCSSRIKEGKKGTSPILLPGTSMFFFPSSTYTIQYCPCLLNS